MTGGTLYNYKSQLMNSTNQLNNAYNTVLTGRRFNAYSEDPASATQAFRLRSSLATADKQATNNDTVIKKFSTAWDIIGDVYEDLTIDMGKVPALEGSNDTNLSVLPELGKVLKSGAEAIVQDMNAKYGDNFIFGGAETLEVPFELNEKGELLYRGQKVDEMDLDDYNAINDSLYVDIGLGFQEADGELISSSAYDSALNGLDFLGYGTDEQGRPNNIISIMNRMGEIFEGYDLETDTFTVGSREEAQELMSKLEDASDNLNEMYTKLDADTKYLNTNLDRLTTTKDNLNEQIGGRGQGPGHHGPGVGPAGLQRRPENRHQHHPAVPAGLHELIDVRKGGSDLVSAH